MIRHRTAWILLIAIAGATAPVWSQTKNLPDAPGSWKPWKSLTAIASVRTERGATAAEVKAFEATLLELNAILRRAPGVAEPRGYSVETWGAMSGLGSPVPGRPAGRLLPLAGSLDFGAFPIFEYVRNGKTIREDSGETALLLFQVNDPWSGTGRRPDEWGSVDTDAFLQPPAGADIAGLPRYGDALVIARPGRSLWTPLPLQAALELVAADQRATATGFQETLDKHKARLAELRGPAKQAERKQSAQMETIARIEEDNLVKETSPTSSSSKGLAEAQRAIDDITSYIAALTPQDRNAASCYAKNAKTLRAKFLVAGNATCAAMVKPNYQYFNPAAPRSAAQVLTITPVAGCLDGSRPGETSPAGCAANRRLIETMDKDAIRAWLK